MLNARILTVDRAFSPDRWIDAPSALNLYARGAVMCTLGETTMRLRGGTNAKTGKQSILEVGSIIVLNSQDWLVKDFDYAPFSRELVFSRDRYTCAYCGMHLDKNTASLEHIIPECQGGQTDFMNTTCSCMPCNQKKGGRRPEQAGMELLFLPYKPNRYEWLILQNRRILADQMDLLRQGLPKHSRVLAQ